MLLKISRIDRHLHSPLVKERYFTQIDKNTLPLVIVGPYEHHSNELSFREGLCECIRIPWIKMEIDFDFLEKLYKNKKEK